MLPVSDLVELARNPAAGRDVGARSPQRYGVPGAHAPVIVWNVCRHCNMSCPHCYAAAAYRPSREDLTTEEARRLLDDLAGCGVRIVIFSGGEPMLRPDLLELLSHAKGLGIAPQLSTNGVYVDEGTARKLAEAGVAYVGVSIDGVPGFNDGYRGMEGGYEAACRGIRSAKSAGMRTGLRMTLTRLNVDQLPRMVELATSLGTDRFYVSHLLYSGRGRRMAGDDLSRSEAREALFSLFEKAESLVEGGAPTRVVTGSNDSDGPLLLRWLEQRYGAEAADPVRRLLIQRGGNSAGEKILNIDHRGRVHPDQFWRSETIGDIRAQRFEEILRHPLRKLLAERTDHLTGRCGSCRYGGLCRGSHRERAIAFYGELWAPDPACVLDDAEIGLETDARPDERVTVG